MPSYYLDSYKSSVNINRLIIRIGSGDFFVFFFLKEMNIAFGMYITSVFLSLSSSYSLAL